MVFRKVRRAQNVNDYETWEQGGVSPTLNVMDNTGETRATVLIIDGTRVGDVRVSEDDVMQTVIQRWGTGGGNVPCVYPIDMRNALRDPEKRDEMNRQGLGLGADGDPSPTVTNAFQPGVATESAVRRLTPRECERLQGFPDDWTAQKLDPIKGIVTQADSSRYKQMGNAVAVPVVEWILGRIMQVENNQGVK